MNPKVLVVDDDAGVRYTLREILEEAEMTVETAEDGVLALEILAEQQVDLIITDLAMPRLDGLELLERLRGMPGAPRAILITAHGSERHAVEAMKLGAYDYFSKPFDIDAVIAVIERAVVAVRQDRENSQLRADLHLSRRMVYESEVMRRIALLVQRVAAKDVTVLITGPSGTGKELLAESIVSASLRKEAPFVRFNCAAVPSQLAEAELFGHVRGAFTGAVKTRQGLFREAHGGTLLLDEIGELALESQGKLLRVLQEGQFRPVGADGELEVDVRILASTNRNLETDVAAGRFREDLFYRLNVIQIRVPPLSERPEDIPPLVDHFLRKYAERFHLDQISLSPNVRAVLCSALYPGNVRELENRIERLVALSSGGRIDEELEVDQGAGSSNEESLGLRQRVEAFERGLVAAELRRSQGNRSEAARRLSIGRVTLLDKIKKYALD